MAEPIYFAPLRVPLVDTRTGLMAREWYLFFQALFLRTGGVTAPSNDDILQTINEGIGTNDLLPLIYQVDQAAAQTPMQELAELQKESLGTAPVAALAEMDKQLQDLLQSPALPSQILPHLQYGNWTPADASGAGLALVVNSATWIKHERLVFARCSISYPATASGANSQISGFPFPVDNLESARQGWVSYTTSTNVFYFMPAGGSSSGFLYSNAGVNLTNAQVSGAALFLSALYTTP